MVYDPAYYQKNKKKMQASQRRWRLKHPEAFRKSCYKWRRKNRKRYLLSCGWYRLMNKERIREHHKLWEKKNRKKGKVHPLAGLDKIGGKDDI